MKIATRIPFKAALVAASITTIGVVAINLLDSGPSYTVAPDDPTTISIVVPDEPPPPPANPPDEVDYAPPGATVSL